MKPTAPIAAAFAAALMAGAPAALAQTNEATPQADIEEMQPYEEPTLRAFADAARKVRGVLDDYGPQLQAAGSQEERSALEQEVSDKMRQAVEDTQGIGLEKYVEIARAAQQSDLLAKTISRYMEEG